MQTIINPRKILEKFPDLPGRFALAIGSFGCTGLFRWAPGTLGTLVGLPLAWAVLQWPQEDRILFWTLIFIAGIVSAKIIDQRLNSLDHPCIVIDEVFGIAIATSSLETQWETPWFLFHWIVAFVLFRILDIFKPFPIGSIDRWAKKPNKNKFNHPLGTALGVMLDDAVAGLLTWATLWVIQELILRM